MPAPTTSELIFSEQSNHSLSKTLGDLKRTTLSIRNRLESIRHDAAFARQVADAYARPLITNERCGSWYVEPEMKSGSAYFKRMPDALSKTIPVWCAVLNRVLFPNEPQLHNLYTPPQVVSQSEHAQMTSLLPTFVDALRALKISLDDLRPHISKALRPVWITPDSEIAPTSEVFEDYHPVGAGDDTENWAHGLTPSLFWGNKDVLLSSPENELPDTIQSLVERAKSKGIFEQGVRLVKPTSVLFVAPITATSAASEACIIALLPTVTSESTWQTSPNRIDVGLGPHKVGSRNARKALPFIIAFVRKFLSRNDVYKEPPKLVFYFIAGCEPKRRNDTKRQ
ncbi:hypothetical protein JHW43_003763 [Diplocarpon mali]|nr:hypothetical protein JHW43_003763 [Diplocarpon mali]